MECNLTEIVEKQSLIISIQSGVINDLFGLLGQYMAAEEMDMLPMVARLHTAAEIRAGID
jgi:hypothetical protein